MKVLDQRSFDVLLMDLEMPLMDGLETTAAIRQREAGTNAHVPIIAMTAHAVKGYQQRCLDAGMDGFVTKPIWPAELFAALETAMAGAAVKKAQGVAAPGLAAIRASRTAD